MSARCIVYALALLAASCGAGSSAARPLRAPAAISGEASVAALSEAHSIEQLLARLPESMRAHYVLVYESRSEQGASPRAPRVLLYNEDATWVLTFNGEAEQRGYDRLELLHFEPQTRRFQLRELRFPHGAARAQLSEINPPRCLRCHGSYPRPIWDSYPSWPGVYDTPSNDPPVEQRADLAAFVAAHSMHPRYRYLLGADELLAARAAPGVLAYQGKSELSASAELGVKLLRLQYLAIARRVSSAPRFRRYQYALLAALNPQCLDIDSFISRIDGSFVRGFDAFARRTRAANLAEAASKAHRGGAAAAARDTTSETLTDFRYVVERGLALPTDDFTLAFERGSYDFASPFPLTGVLAAELVLAIERVDPSIRELYARRHDEDAYCGELRRRSLAQSR
jgi:hypothetical protein